MVTYATHRPVVQRSPKRKGQGWIRIDKQDDLAADGEFPIVRNLAGGEIGYDEYNLAITLYRSEPREYPPMHASTSTAGVNLDREQATALRDALTEWIGARIEEDPA